MSGLTNHAENKIADWRFGRAAVTPPATYHYALIRATRGYSSAIRSQAAALGDTVLPTTPNGRLYRCTTAGVCGAGEPTWPTADGGTVTDGAAVWTEMTPDFEANANLTEVVGGGYARVAIAANATNWSGTQAPGSTAVSSGSDGTIENNVAIAFGAPSANWGVIAGWTSNDAATAGNAWDWSVLATPKTVNNGDAAPSFPISAMSIQIDA